MAAWNPGWDGVAALSTRSATFALGLRALFCDAPQTTYRRLADRRCSSSYAAAASYPAQVSQNAQMSRAAADFTPQFCRPRWASGNGLLPSRLAAAGADRELRRAGTERWTQQRNIFRSRSSSGMEGDRTDLRQGKVVEGGIQTFLPGVSSWCSRDTAPGHAAKGLPILAPLHGGMALATDIGQLQSRTSRWGRRRASRCGRRCPHARTFHTVVTQDARISSAGPVFTRSAAVSLLAPSISAGRLPVRSPGRVGVS